MTTATSSKDLVNTSLLAGFSSVVEGGLEVELHFFNEMILMMPETLSVNGAKATIAQVEADKGRLPSLVSSASQDFVRTGIVRALKGGSDVTLTESLNVAIQGRKRLNSKAFNEILSAEGATFASVKKAVYLVPAKENAPRATTPKGVDGLMVALLEALEAEDFDGIISNPVLALALAKQLTGCANHSVKIAS
jgi:hypothetical protein